MTRKTGSGSAKNVCGSTALVSVEEENFVFRPCGFFLKIGCTLVAVEFDEEAR